MKKTLLKTLLLTCLLSVWGANCYAATLEVENGTFEEWTDTSTPVGWASNTGSNATLSQSTDFHGGTYSVSIAHASGNNRRMASKDYTLSAGTYTVSFYAKSADTDALGMLSMGYVPITNGSAGSYTYVNTQVSISADWTEQTFSFTLTAETTLEFIVMNHQNGSGAVLVDDYTVTYEESETQSGHGYSADDPYTCEEALALAKELDSSTTLSGVYVKGTISQIDEISTSYGNATYYISDDGTTTDHLEVFRGYSLNGDKFTSEDEIKVGDEVIVNGDLVDYNGKTPEITTGSKIYSINGSTEKPDGGGGGDDGGIEGTVTHGTSMITLTNPDVSVGTNTATFDVTEITGIENGASVDGTIFELSDEGTIVFEKASGSSAPAYYTTSGNIEIRVYFDNTITFTCKQKIAKIEIMTETTSYEGSNVETVVFSEDGTSAEFCNVRDGSNTTQLRVEYVTVYYEGEGGDEEPEPSGHGYEPNDPYTCEEAIEVISALASGGTIEGIYVKGIVSQIGNYSSSYGDLIYYISDDGTTSNQLEIYYGYYLNNEKFTDNYAEELMVGDEVIVYGTFTNYNGNTPEGSQGSTYIYSLTRNGETPEPSPEEEHTFNFAENTYGMTVYSGSDSDYETEVTQITSDGVVLNFNSGHYRMWNSSAEGNHLRIGGATTSNYDAYCTISGPTGSKVLEVVITSTGSSDNMSESNPTVDLEGGSYASHVYTWTGEAESVTFHFTSVTHVYYIDVTTVATTGSFTITEAGYATYYTDYEYTMPEGVTGTTVTGVEDTAMTDGGYLLETAWGYTAGTTVPAKTALVLKGEANTYTYAITSTEATAPTDNLLLGSTSETETTGPNGETTGYVFYELTNGNSGIGFYYGKDGGAAFQSAANKAWLPLSETQARNAKFLGFDEGDTTGITSVENEAKTVKGIYTLQGVKVSNMSQPGLYIVDGKKVIKR